LTDPEGCCLQPALGRFDEKLDSTSTIETTEEGKSTHLLADILALSVAVAHAPPRVILRFLREWLSAGPRLSNGNTRREEHPDMSGMRRSQSKIEQVAGAADVRLEGG
jgi:hypothetical protein